MSERLGDAVLELRTDSKKFDKGMRTAETRTQGLKREFGSVAKKASIMATAAVGAFALIGRAALQTADEINQASTALGISAERFQKLRFAFQRFNLDTADVGDALGTLADRAQDAKDGMESFIDDFRLLGIEVEDIKGKSPEELFRLFADGVASVENASRRTTGVVRILGDDLGRKLLPLLRGGADQIDRFGDNAEEMGLILSEKTLQGADDFGEAMNRMSTAMSVTGARMTSDLAEPFSHAVELITRGIGQVRNDSEALAQEDNIRAWGASTLDVFATVADAARIVGKTIKTVLVSAGEEIGARAASAAAVLRGDFKESARILLDFNERQSARVRELMDMNVTAVRDMVEEIRNGQAEVESIQSRTAQGLQLPGTEGGGGTTNNAIGDVRRLEKVTVDATERMVSAYSDVGDATDEMSQFTIQAARNMQSAFADFLFDPFEDGLDGMLKSFSDTLRRMAAEAASKMLLNAVMSAAGGGGGLFPGGASAEAGGFFGDFASGGSFEVGGKSGIDRNLVAFNASKGEQVTVTPSGKGGGQGLVFAPTIQVDMSNSALEEDFVGTIQQGVGEQLRASERRMREFVVRGAS